MLKLHTAVIIDCPTHSSLDPKIFDTQIMYKWYCDVAEYLKVIIELTCIENIVYASYGSNHEVNDTCTDIVFKNHKMFPGKLNKASAYSPYEKAKFFEDKKILLVGQSFYTCIQQRELGFVNLLRTPSIAGVYSSPPLVGYFGVGPGSTPDDESKKHNCPVGIVKATDKDFENDKRVNWIREDLTDIYRVFKCEPINS